MAACMHGICLYNSCMKKSCRILLGQCEGVKVTDGGGAQTGCLHARLFRSPAFVSFSQVAAGKAGKYSVATILPGRYGSPDCMRPAHVHFKCADSSDAGI